MTPPDFRIGTGFDVHAFAEGRRLVLGGVDVPHHRGLAGHSDGDPAVHALIDGLLGARALPDIGQRFPPGDARFKDADSLDLLDDVVAEMAQEHWNVVNVDLTIIAQEPRLGSCLAAMRARLAERLRVDVDCVGVKATTTDHLGALGRSEGIGAQAIVLIQRAGDSG